ncbi:MAG TPA: DUF6519 domain-containing protein, partial [Blastocatellia bacterium]|nr:DUF6519 domain-containing protein [Blastocatellia bacterium]
MKSDLSRRTFDPKKHYSGVRMQQGRVQLDADWNEQAEIAIHREDTEALDVIGGCGGPVHDAAFGVILKVPILALEDKAAVSIPTPIIGPPPPVIQPGPDDFLLSAGRYYVDGILCENDGSVLFSKQPDLPALTGVPAIPTQADATRFPAYLVYLDVWQRNITALDDPAIHEVALGGPDTATRLKTIWQVKLFGEADPSADCTKAFTELKNSLQADGTLNARTNPGAADPNPCIISASAAFRGLENQLYRVEIHNPGPAFDIAAPLSGTPAPVTQINPTTISVPGTWAIGQAVEVFLTAANSDPKARRLFVITGI